MEILKSLKELGNILAYVANMSRLSTQDIGTFSNYALDNSWVHYPGLGVNTVSALATAFRLQGKCFRLSDSNEDFIFKFI